MIIPEHVQGMPQRIDIPLLHVLVGASGCARLQKLFSLATSFLAAVPRYHLTQSTTQMRRLGIATFAPHLDSDESAEWNAASVANGEVIWRSAKVRGNEFRYGCPVWNLTILGW